MNLKPDSKRALGKTYTGVRYQTQNTVDLGMEKTRKGPLWSHSGCGSCIGSLLKRLQCQQVERSRLGEKLFHLCEALGGHGPRAEKGQKLNSGLTKTVPEWHCGRYRLGALG